MPNIGPVELIIILVIALIVIGPGRLPDVGAALGKSIREFRKASSDLTDAARVDVSPQAAPAPAAPPAAPAAAAPQPAQAAPNTLAQETAPNTLTTPPADPAPVAAASSGDDAAAPPA
jgi:sec-independent protein translocase protein TatA